MTWVAMWILPLAIITLMKIVGELSVPMPVRVGPVLLNLHYGSSDVLMYMLVQEKIAAMFMMHLR